MSTSLQHVHAVWDKIRTNSPIYDFLLTRAGPHPRKTPHRSPARQFQEFFTEFCRSPS
ncbi:hypothetical protein AWENTII_011257 [Aspergillus wentii]